MSSTERSTHSYSALAAIAVAASLVLALPAPALAATSTNDDAAVVMIEEVPLTVATDELADPDMREPVKAAIKRDAKPVFELYEGMGKSLEGVSIEVMVSEPGEPGVFEISVTGRGATGQTKQETVTCEYCTESDLVGRAVEAVGKLLPTLDQGEAAGPEPTPAPEPTPEQPPAQTGDNKTDTGRAKDKKLGPLGIGGAVAIGVGAATVMPGVILAVREDTQTGDTENDVTKQSTRTPGYVLIGVGAAVLVTGVALLVTDRMRAKKQNRRETAPNAVLVPTGTGVSLVGRF